MKKIVAERKAAEAEWRKANPEKAAQMDEWFSGKAPKVDYPRWRKATSLVQVILGEPLGKIYCERFFPASSKSRMVQLVKNLQKALGERIEEQAWMTPATKKVAREKLDAFYIKVGYPDKWRDYSGLAIDPAKSLYENLRIASKFISKQRQDEKVGKPVDRDEWHMTPQTVNAYYNPTTNEICFPAGILQYPFFDPEADDAFNYGAIGVVIGHEMTHGFDDQGCHFDKNGNMTEWWTKEDTENFAKLGEYYADFFSKIEKYGTKVYFAHPYTSWERAQNERHNGLLRRYVPKGISIENFSDEDILWAADALNSLPRKNLGYCTPEELFEAFLDIVCAA